MGSVSKDKATWRTPTPPKNAMIVAVSNPLPPAFHAKPSGSAAHEILEDRKRSFPFLTPSRKKTYRNHDRFVPRRSSIDIFKTSAHPDSLTPSERFTRRTHARSPADFRVADGRTRTLSQHPMTIRTQSGQRRTASGRVLDGVYSMGATPPFHGPTTRVSISLSNDLETIEEEAKRHQGRVALALGIDRKAKVFSFGGGDELLMRRRSNGFGGGGLMDIWRTGWEPSRTVLPKGKAVIKGTNHRNVPHSPFRVLDAPGLRDDYYTSLLAYSPVSNSLAVGLAHDVYSWTEAKGAQPFKPWSEAHVTCLAFSSKEGRLNILAIGRVDGSLSLWRPGEPSPRIERNHTSGVATVAWRPTPVELLRTQSEELLVGDEQGTVYYYRVDWNGPEEDSPPAPVDCTLTLLIKIHPHTQQICGLAWSVDGRQFATGGNDNLACLFEAHTVLEHAALGAPTETPLHRYQWAHGAAVKAIAFCPWQASLLATGGGSNDRSIHFFHTYSGANLASILVAAQVTSLIWSTSHREIAATFGYSNPEHKMRIGVFSWPDCKQVVSIPWQEEMRALYAIAYPGGPDPAGRGGRRSDQGSTDTDGHAACLVVAASDETVRFHEIWGKSRKTVYPKAGVLGGSSILEYDEGIYGEGFLEVIR
ncbi:WD40 repeat-like protein [Ascobolus immersus RN42]|uniref:WD40 repeat-like protein n=1 Tax=Ascobolus immersus RN42 TaxID=1160509 RepID=A0A3N4IKZ7_ASCIM|nr:WD40 repeat-like protein [Ascobolus immersus RN42]